MKRVPIKEIARLAGYGTAVVLIGIGFGLIYVLNRGSLLHAECREDDQD